MKILLMLMSLETKFSHPIQEQIKKIIAYFGTSGVFVALWVNRAAVVIDSLLYLTIYPDHKAGYFLNSAVGLYNMFYLELELKKKLNLPSLYETELAFNRLALL